MLHLSGVTPARPLTLDEARPKIVAALKENAPRAAVSPPRRRRSARKSADALKAGKSFADAAKDAGSDGAGHARLFARNPSPPTPRRTPRARWPELLRGGAAVGELSKFLPTADGGALVFVRGPLGVDEAQFDKAKDTFALRMRRQKTRAAFEEWLRSSKQAADAKLTVQLRG